MKTFKPSALTAALLVGGMQLSGFSSLVMAQEAPQVPAQEAEQTADIEVIKVKGFRRSLIESLNVKRFSDTIVEAVSADDMGALPDVSIADSISRLSGVTAVRSGGQSSELNIRGLSGNFVFATLNGREQVSTSGSRSIEFDQYPSEMMSNVVVYKTPDASVMAQAIGGTIDMQTVRPLSHGGIALAASLLVMGAVSRSRLQEIFLGSTAERVLDRIGCDVLVVKPADFAEKLAELTGGPVPVHTRAGGDED